MPNPLNKPDILSIIPNSLREELIESYNKIHQNYLEGRWEPSVIQELNLC